MATSDQVVMSDVPTSINGDSPFEVKINFSGNPSDYKNKTYYIRGVFFELPDSENYFGFTKNNAGEFVSTANPPTNLFAITTSEQATYSGSLTFKADITSSHFKGAGTYGFKLGRYTTSGFANWYSSDYKVIDIKQTNPSPSPIVNLTTPTPSPTISPTSTPSPTPSPTSFATPSPSNITPPTSKPTPTTTLPASVTANSNNYNIEQWNDSSPIPTNDPNERVPDVLGMSTKPEPKTFPWGGLLLTLGGLLIVSGCIWWMWKMQEEGA